MDGHLLVLCSKTVWRLFNELSRKIRPSEKLQGIPIALKIPFLSWELHKPSLKEKLLKNHDDFFTGK